MRLLCSFVGGNGHFEPLVPIARLAVAAGHTVAFTCRPGMIPTVEKAGFAAFASGPDFGDSDKRYPLVEVNMEREEEALRESFARRLARERAQDILAVCREWQPDVIVCDEIDFGGMIAAERLGLPYASVLVIASGSFVRREVVADALNAVRGEYDLPPDPDLTMLSRYLVLSPVPPSYRDPLFPLPPTGHSIRPFMLNAPQNETTPQWLENLPDMPTVYFTLGTVFNRESGDLFSRVLMALRDLSINLIVTVGTHIDPTEFGAQPDNVRIERFIPQLLLLPHCDLVVSHGGSGSILGALAHGLPSVLIPMGADQPLNAARYQALGAAEILDAITATPELIRQTVSTVLDNSSYRIAAERLRDEIATLPPSEHAVKLLERLAVEKQPLLAI
jgi:UDP:flavonoid glycosyltransferase YjiC (YdhE family)